MTNTLSQHAVATPCSQSLVRLASRGLALAGLLSVFTFTDTSHADTRQLTIPKTVVSTAFNTAVGSMQVHLDNYGQKRGVSWHEDQSYVLLPNGQRRAIPVPEESINVTKRREIKYYVDGLDSSRISAAVDGDRIKLTLEFESQGEEIKGKCVRDPVVGKDKECSLKMERDVHLNNTRLDIWLRPVAHGGSISYADPQVSFRTDVKIASRLCQTFKGICGRIESFINRRLTKEINQSVTRALQDPGAVRAVGDAVRRATAMREHLVPGYEVKSVRGRGDSFVVTVEK